MTELAPGRVGRTVADPSDESRAHFAARPPSSKANEARSLEDSAPRISEIVKIESRRGPLRAHSSPFRKNDGVRIP